MKSILIFAYILYSCQAGPITKGDILINSSPESIPEVGGISPESTVTESTTLLKNQSSRITTPISTKSIETTVGPASILITDPPVPTTLKPTTSSTVKPSTTTPSKTPPTTKSSTTEKPTVKPTATTSTHPIISTTSTPPPSNRGFDGPSFIGGIVLASGLMAIGFVAFKFYRARTELNYHTL